MIFTLIYLMPGKPQLLGDGFAEGSAYDCT